MSYIILSFNGGEILNIKQGFDAIEYALMEQGYNVGRDFKIEYLKDTFKISFCLKKTHRVFDINDIYKCIGCPNIKGFKIQMHHDRKEVVLYIILKMEEY